MTSKKYLLGDTDFTESITYLDGLGRAVQTQALDSTGRYIVTALDYDKMGRPWKEWKPYYRSTSGAFDAAYVNNAKAAYNNVTNPFVEKLYRADPLARLTHVIPEGGTSSAALRYTYLVDTGAKFAYTEILEETNRRTDVYTDLFGNSVRTVGAAHASTESARTDVIFDVLGLQREVRPPNYHNPPSGSSASNWSGTYLADPLGRLVRKTTPDAETVKYKYDRASNLRFAQDQKQSAAGRVLFTRYDHGDRPLVTGEASATFSGLEPHFTQSFETTTSNWLSVHHYGSKPGTSSEPWSLFSTQITAATMGNLKGRVAATAHKSDGLWQITLYSYDSRGRVVTKFQYTEDFKTSGGALIATTHSYTFDRQANLLQTQTAVGAQSLYHWYEYDRASRLFRAFVNTTSTKPTVAAARYAYNPTGTTDSLKFNASGSSQLLAVPYAYNLRDWITDIGSITSTAYPFSSKIAYQANGNVSTAEFYNDGIGSQKRYRQTYAYDGLNRITSGNYAFWTGSSYFTSSNYLVNGITYDRNGNIKTLARRDQAATLIDNLTYNYGSTNRLSSVTENAPVTPGIDWDVEATAFTYDANGNVSAATGAYQITSASYDYRNLPVTLVAKGTTNKYRYTAEGQRYYKKVGTEAAQYDILDGARIIGTFTPTGGWVRWNLYGQDLIGRIDSEGRRYYVKDHLGSIRSAIDQTGAIKEAFDYSPFGLLMPGRSTFSVTAARERFTGKERDFETGLDYFGARYYMPALGRWTSVDPLAEKYPAYSPYQYVGNNPVTLIDPDGRKIVNPNNIVLNNKHLRQQLRKLNAAIAKRTGLRSDQFVLRISGGDRYKSDGRIISATSGDEIASSAPRSAHLLEQGARAVDLQIDVDGEGVVTNALVNEIAAEIGFTHNYYNYNDGHIHLGLPSEFSHDGAKSDHIPASAEFETSPKRGITTPSIRTHKWIWEGRKLRLIPREEKNPSDLDKTL